MVLHFLNRGMIVFCYLYSTFSFFTHFIFTTTAKIIRHYVHFGHLWENVKAIVDLCYLIVQQLVECVWLYYRKSD